MEYFSTLNLNEQSRGSRNPPRRRDGRKTGENKSIMELLENDDCFSTLVEYLEENSNLRDDLDNTDEKMTFFAPTNEAFKRFKEIMKPSEGHSERRRGDDRRRFGGHEEMPKMKEILNYHMIKDVYSCKDMFDGQLLESKLRVKELDDNKQRVRVAKMFGGVYLNFCTRIQEFDMKAGNGVVHVVDFVMIPPMDAYRVAFHLPFCFSTFLMAVNETGMREELEEGKTQTVMMPSNKAWKQMHPNDLLYLFSPMGCNDLKKIIQYHICTDLEYAPEMMDEEKTKLKTLLEDEEMCIQTWRRGQEESERRRRDSNPRRRGSKFSESPNQYMFVINDGEANIKMTDMITRNGNIHEISSVLIPRNVRLPSMREGREK